MPHDRAEGERGVLRRALGLNAAMFVVGLAAGLAADSLGLVADSLDMLAIAALSLLVNAHVIRLLARFRRGEVHLRAAWLFTRADVVANLGVILSGVLVLGTGSRWPDLVIGLAIGGYVIREALAILGQARETLAQSA